MMKSADCKTTVMKKTVSFTKHSTNIFFHILTRCNLNCRHCYINPLQHGTTTLSIDTINQWLLLFSKKCKNPNVIFLGGEPTLHPELSTAVKTAKSAGYATVTIDTNGYLFNDILSTVSPDEVDFFSFSLDGPDKKTNDALRGRGSFDTCTQGIRQAKRKGFNTSLIYTVSRANIDKLEEMPPLIDQLGINRFFIQVIGMRGTWKDEKKNKGKLIEQVSRSDWLEIVPSVAEKAAELGIPTTYPKVFLTSDEPFECAGLVADNYFIFPNGRVYQCPLCEDYPLHGYEIKSNRLIKTEKINEKDLFNLTIPEGCVINKLVQPDNLSYDEKGVPEYKIACCMLKQEVTH